MNYTIIKTEIADNFDKLVGAGFNSISKNAPPAKLIEFIKGHNCLVACKGQIFITDFQTFKNASPEIGCSWLDEELKEKHPADYLDKMKTLSASLT